MSPQASSSDLRASRWTILAAAIILLAGAAAYLNSFSGAFVFDDFFCITENREIRHLWPLGDVLFPPLNSAAAGVAGRPVVNLSLAVNYALGGTNVWGYHAFNLAIHLLAALTLLGLVRRTLLLPVLCERFGSRATVLSLAVAILWTIHPLQTEAVTYVIQRAESLMGLCYLLTLYCVLRGATAKGAAFWHVFGVVACLIGMATKEVMATAPLIVLLYDRTFLAGSFRAAWRARRGLYLALAATWGAIAWGLLATDFHGGSTGFAVKEFTWWSYLLTEPGVILHYLRLAIWPVGQCLDYNWPAAGAPAEIVLPGLLMAGLLSLTGWAIWKRPLMGFLGAWFFVILAPTSSFVPIQDAACEHRMYLCLAAVVTGGVLAGDALLRMIEGSRLRRQIWARTLGFGLLAVTCIALGTMTVARNNVYSSERSIWQNTLEQAPDNARAHSSLAIALASERQYDAAIAHFQKALDIKPVYAVHNNLGTALAARGRVREALEQYQQALAIKPDYDSALHNRNNLLARLELYKASKSHRDGVKAE